MGSETNMGILDNVNQTLTASSKVMQNQLVMRKVSPQLSPDDLLPLRRTCHLWNRQFVPELRKKHTPVKLGTNADEFLDLIRRNTDGIPFAKYILETFQPQHLQGFLQVCGPVITSLAIKEEAEKELGAEGVRHIVFGGRLPKLHSLRIDTSDHIEAAAPQFWTPDLLAVPLPRLRRLGFSYSANCDPLYRTVMSDLLRAAPGLEELSLWSSGEEGGGGGGFVQALLASLLTAGASSPTNTLKVLATSRLTAAEHRVLVELARQGVLRLQSFSVVLDNEEEEGRAVEALQEFLPTQSSTLRKLALYNADDSETRGVIRLPRLERVHSLKLVNIDLRFEGDIETCLPGLTRLHIDDAYWFPEESFPAASLAHSGVTELQVKMGAWKLVLLAPHLPAVTRATVRFEPEGLVYFPGLPVIAGSMNDEDVAWRRISACWPELEELDLGGVMPKRLDAFLAGVPVKRLNRLQYELGRLKGTTPRLETLRAIRDKVKGGQLPCLGGLHRLKKVTLHLGVSDRLTDIGVYFGLALAGPDLKRITIRGGKGNRVSQRAVGFLRALVGPNAVIDLDNNEPPRAAVLNRIMTPFTKLFSRLI